MNIFKENVFCDDKMKIIVILYIGFKQEKIIFFIGAQMKELILIPSYKPDERLLEFIESLKKEGICDVVVIDDGSGEKYKEIYEKVKSEYPGCDIIYHAVNLGKGRALKSAFNHILNTYDNLLGVVACDADGQHPASSVKEALETMRSHPDKLILGTRKFFRGKNVPVANLIGNMITILAFKILTGLSFGDTQCGLRAFPKTIMEKLISTKGERFEYENIMLLDLRKNNIDYAEFPMQAVYLEEGEYTSHFNKLRDSFWIYVNILKFATLPIISGIAAYIFTIMFFAYLPMCSLLKTGLFYGAGLLVGWLTMLLPLPDDKGKWYTILYPIAHTALFSTVFYWLLNYTPISFHASWWLTAILAAPTAYAIYLKLRYGKKPKRVKINKNGD